MSYNILASLKNAREKLCKAAVALGSECLCDQKASAVIEFVNDINRVSDAISGMVIAAPQKNEEEQEEEEKRSYRASRSPSPRESRRSKRERSLSRRRSPDKRARERSEDRGKHDTDPKSVYIRYLPGHDPFVGRRNVEDEKERLRRIFSDYGAVERTYLWSYVWYNKDPDTGKQEAIKTPMARVRFESEDAKLRAMDKAEELADRRSLFIGASKFDNSTKN
jgi:hypothetical protein